MIPKISVIVAHPKQGSFNHAIAEAVITELNQKKYEINYHDLYTEKFDPVIPAGEIPKGVSIPPFIAQHCEEISQADGIIIIHPNWWGQPPAILKGWIDRVLRPGVTYDFVEGDNGEGIPRGLLKAKTACIFNTANTSKEREENIFHDPLEYIWKNCIFDLCGVKKIYRKMFRILVTSSPEDRQGWLEEVRKKVRELF